MTIPDYVEPAFTSNTTLAPGLYLTMPQGHAQLVGTPRRSSSDGPAVHRHLTVQNMGSVVTIAGVDIDDPDVLATFADHLLMLSLRQARELAHPYRPGTPDARRRDEAARVGELWDRNGKPIKSRASVRVYSPAGEYLGLTWVDRVDRTAGVAFVETTMTTMDDTIETLSAPVVFPEDVEVVDE
jgi:hypothetical protein